MILVRNRSVDAEAVNHRIPAAVQERMDYNE